MTTPRPFSSDVKRAVYSSVIIHTIFCIQVFMALPKSMVFTQASLFVFFSHYFLMFLSLMPDPLHENGAVDYGRLWELLVVSFPASLAYGAIVAVVLAIMGKPTP
jgi:hypothetical protein